MIHDGSHFRIKQLAYIFTPLCVLFADLSSKHYAESVLREGESVQILGSFLQFTLLHNSGTTFGLFSATSPFLAILLPKLILVLVVFICFLNVAKFIKSARLQILSSVCFLAIIGGSCGNVIDRLTDRTVTDFIDIGIQSYRWYVFNVGDAFQFLGGLTVLSILAWQHQKA